MILYCLTFSLLLAGALAGDPDECRTIEQIVRSHGFDLEHHNVTTADGYILTLHRLITPSPVYHSQRRNYYEYEIEKKPVILQHGLLGSSADFFISSPFLTGNNNSSVEGDNLAFTLHLTQRYDVWLSNSRGNRYSRGHRKFSDSSAEYWRFSFDQMAVYDVPAVIDYVRNVTSRRTVGYIGFSQGTATMFALLSLRPEYSVIVRPFLALAPVSTVASVRSPIRYLAPFAPVFRELGGEFLPSTPAVNRLSNLLCRYYLEEKYICQNIVFFLSGFDAKHLNLTRIPVYFQFLPSTASNWEIVHWAQLIESKRFARFDYGSEEENRAAYGQATAPDFPLEDIPSNAIIGLFRARNDYLSSVPDQERLIRIFKKNNVRLIDYVVPDPKWTHVDFVFGIDAGSLVYEKVIEVLDKYTR